MCAAVRACNDMRARGKLELEFQIIGDNLGVLYNSIKFSNRVSIVILIYLG